MSSILYYITSHGYGHAVRSNQVIRALHQAGENVQVHVRTGAPEWLFSNSSRRVSYTKQSLDVGVVQPNSLRMDLEATFRACRELHDRMPNLVEQEVKFIKQQKIDLIAGDIPPACFEIAARANIPSVAITNFTWDVIYRAYTDDHPGFVPLIQEMTRFYSKATLALVLPYPCEMSMFPRREAIPWVTRVSALSRSRARAAFGLPQSGTIVLLSFGGLGLAEFPWLQLDEMTDFFFVTTAAAGESRGNLLFLDDAQRHYEDLLRAVDVIVTKPGYGIVADVLAQRLPVLYTERGEFAEYRFLVQALNDLATAEFIPQDELLSGNIRPYLLRLLEKDQFWPSVQLNGADVAAENILALLEH
ncbi:MAG: glycosyltransferase family protein [Candidatus Binatia bacterium]